MKIFLRVAVFFLFAPSIISPSLAGEESFNPKSMAYVLQAEELAEKRNEAVIKLAGCGRDVVVIDACFSGDQKNGRWTKDEVNKIRSGKEGRKVIAYISVGEAEDYRSYWGKDWDKNKDGKPDGGAPKFLCGENPDWEGNYKVKYWQEEWQKIILADMDKIVEAGFDGVYLDIVDAFEFFEEKNGEYVDERKNDETGNSYRRDMVEWVSKIAGHCRNNAGDGFIVIPQNGSQLLAYGEYVKKISAIGVEDLFTLGNKKQKKGHAEYVLGFLAKIREAGKPVLEIEYATKADKIALARKKAKEYGFILLLTDRELKTLGVSP